jgi:hypothetical protein
MTQAVRNVHEHLAVTSLWFKGKTVQELEKCQTGTYRHLAYTVSYVNRKSMGVLHIAAYNMARKFNFCVYLP